MVLDTISATRAALAPHRARTIGLVPTMGALHAGHLSLVARARGECEIVVASLFVNPTQFGPNEDFARYPRQFEQDCALFAQAGVDFVFAPSVEEMYPAGATTCVDVGELGNRLDGASRPGHFRGVATVVAKLFHIVQPGRAYFGQKDAVQVTVLRRMVRDLNFPVDLIACPIVRDADGLALSSRNAYLSPAEREQALAIPRAIQAMQAATENVLATGHNIVTQEPGVALEYLVAVDPETLLPVSEIIPGTLIAIAARVSNTRLIDNFVT